jgi:putative Mn2+ efflux pump MntP
MPVLGWLVGRTIEPLIRNYDHWVAFGMLAFVGLRMIYAAFRGEDVQSPDPSRGWTLVMLSIAVSIDALAVGLSLALIRVPVLFPCTVIGAVAGGMTLLGLQIGKRAGDLLGRRMEVVGGLVLIAIAVRVLLEHFGI